MTLTELLFVLTISAIVGGIAIPRARHGLDSVKVRAAREAAFGIAAHTRMVALAHAGADFVVDTNSKTASVVDAGGTTAFSASLAEYDVDIYAAGSSARIVLHYDSRGIGRMASQTVRFRRGAAEAGITFSSYGRMRRW